MVYLSRVDTFEALADPVRRSLLRSLRSGAARVVDLAAGLPVSRPAVSRHLRLLTEAGLVVATDRGRERHYALRPAGLATVTDLVDELCDARPGWPSGHALDALETEVRRTSRDRRSTTPTHRSEDHEETA